MRLWKVQEIGNILTSMSNGAILKDFFDFALLQSCIRRPEVDNMIYFNILYL